MILTYIITCLIFKENMYPKPCNNIKTKINVLVHTSMKKITNSDCK